MIKISKIIGKFIRNSSQREIDQLKLIVKKINDLEAKVREIPDKSFHAKTAEFKAKIKNETKDFFYGDQILWLQIVFLK